MAHTVSAELVGSIGQVSVQVGDTVRATDTLVIIESMKMEIPVLAEVPGVVSALAVEVGSQVTEGDVIAVIEAAS
ncbi:Biotin-requiring enzyme [Frankineae bacterium MT45]|nr:Biotin-requiring enzyme [Frankineae bacterium MT45]